MGFSVLQYTSCILYIKYRLIYLAHGKSYNQIGLRPRGNPPLVPQF